MLSKSKHLQLHIAPTFQPRRTFVRATSAKWFHHQPIAIWRGTMLNIREEGRHNFKTNWDLPLVYCGPESPRQTSKELIETSVLVGNWVSEEIFCKPLICPDVYTGRRPPGVKSKLGSLYSVLLLFPILDYICSSWLSLFLFEYCINCRLDKVRMILSVSPV